MTKADAESSRGRPAVVLESGQVLDHFTVADRAARVAAALMQPGVESGDVVALISESSSGALEVLWAARQAGLVLLPLDPSLSLDEIAYVVNDSGARVLIASQRFADLAASLPPLTPYVLARFLLDGTTAGHRSLTLARSTASPFREQQPSRGTLHYTASSTGRPTAYRVPDADREDLAAVLGIEAAAALGPDSLLVTVCPISDPVSAQLVAAVNAEGGTVVALTRATPDRLLQAITQHRATIVHLSPGGAIRLAKLPRALWSRIRHDNVQVALLSAPSCPRDALIALIQNWAPVIRQLYVSPDCTVVAALDSAGMRGRPGSVGRDPRGLLAVVGDDGEPVPVGDEGWVRTHRDNEDTTLRERGHLDCDGYLYLADREIFAGAGGVVVPREIENVLVNHPAVAGAAVVALTDMGVNRGPIAFVEIADRLHPIANLEDELMAYLSDRLPEPWLPRRITFTARLPRTASGKLDKRRLAPRDGLAEQSLD